MPRKPIITAAIAASLATSATSAVNAASEDATDGDIIATETVADDILIHNGATADLGDLIDPWEPSTFENSDPEIEMYLAQTIYAGGGDDNVISPGNAGKGLKLKKPGRGITLDNGIKKPGRGITLDNGIKKPGKLRKGKKLRKLK